MSEPIDVKSFRGRYTVQLLRIGRRPAGHHSFSAAEAEAERLIAAHPGATFIISQEVARVKRGPLGARS